MSNKPVEFWPDLILDPQTISIAVDRFRELIVTRDEFDRAFVSFDLGLARDWEWYKTALWETARALSGAAEWTRAKIGKGDILRGVVDAIERGSGNFFDGKRRYGPPSARLQDAAKGTVGLREVEGVLYDVIWDGDPESTFEALVDLVGRQYSLVAFLFWMRDDDRSFMPILTRTFDQVLGALGVPLKTTGRCSWDNYSRFNGALAKIAVALEESLGQPVRLVDAHSFCFMLVKLEAKEPEGRIHTSQASADLDPLDVTVRMLAGSIRSASAQAGKTRSSRAKDKPLEIDPEVLEAVIRELFAEGDGRCALTGIPMEYVGVASDPSFIASPDRIDSNGPYSQENLQLVCRFANSWKGAMPDMKFRQLLERVRAES